MIWKNGEQGGDCQPKRPKYIPIASRQIHLICFYPIMYILLCGGHHKIHFNSANLDREKIKAAVRNVPKGEEIVETTASRLRQEGFDEGVLIGEARGETRGETRGIQIMLEEFLQERFGVIHPVLTNKIKSIEATNTLRGLFRQALKVESMQEFNRILDRMLQPL
jgi:hypothetical protein